jgi:GT2 family glycosyltransferase
LNYNGRKYLEQFLPQVLNTTDAPGVSVVIADNASTDDSRQWLASHYPQLSVLPLEQNLGFAGGYNAALEQVDADFYVLLNSDIEVTHGWWEPCLQALLAEPQLAAVQPKIRAYHQRDHFEYAGGAGGWLDYYGYPFCRGRIFASTEVDEGQYDEPQEIFWASGAALFIRATLFHQLGGFDADYFAHAEEIDLCWRLKRAGYKIMAIPNATVYHVGGGTLNYQSVQKTFLNFRNTLITSYKNEPKRKLAWWIPLRLVLDGLAGVLFLSQGKFAHILAIVRAHWHFFLRLGYWRSRRRFYRQLIQRFQVGPSRVAVGTYPGSVVWAYYGRQKRRFKDLFLSKA